MGDEGRSADVSHEARPKQPFLRRGEGVTKRVYAPLHVFRAPPKPVKAASRPVAHQTHVTTHAKAPVTSARAAAAAPPSWQWAAPCHDTEFNQNDGYVSGSNDDELQGEATFLQLDSSSKGSAPHQLITVGQQPWVQVPDARPPLGGMSTALDRETHQLEQELELEEFRTLELQLKREMGRRQGDSAAAREERAQAAHLSHPPRGAVGSTRQAPSTQWPHTQRPAPQQHTASHAHSDNVAGSSRAAAEQLVGRGAARSLVDEDSGSDEWEEWDPQSVEPAGGDVGTLDQDVKQSPGEEDEPEAPGGHQQQDRRASSSGGGAGPLELAQFQRELSAGGSAAGRECFTTSVHFDDISEWADEREGRAANDVNWAEHETGYQAGCQAGHEQAAHSWQGQHHDATGLPHAPAVSHQASQQCSHGSAANIRQQHLNQQHSQQLLQHSHQQSQGSHHLHDGHASAPAGAQCEEAIEWDDATSACSGQITQPFVRSLFGKAQQQQRAGQRPKQHKGGNSRQPAGPSPAELERQRRLDEELSLVSAERQQLAKMRNELDKAAVRLEQDRLACDKAKAEQAAAFEAFKAAESAKLRRQTRVLEQQGRALLKLPTKKERSALETAEAALEAERREGRSREARHKLTVERLRRQVIELQEKVHELREEVRWHEAQQLAGSFGRAKPGSDAKAAPDAPSRPSGPAAAASLATQGLPTSQPTASAATAARHLPAAAGARGRGVLRGPGTAAAVPPVRSGYAAVAASRHLPAGTMTVGGGSGAGGLPHRTDGGIAVSWRPESGAPLEGQAAGTAGQQPTKDNVHLRWRGSHSDCSDEEEEETEERGGGDAGSSRPTGVWTVGLSNGTMFAVGDCEEVSDEEPDAVGAACDQDVSHDTGRRAHRDVMGQHRAQDHQQPRAGDLTAPPPQQRLPHQQAHASHEQLQPSHQQPQPPHQQLQPSQQPQQQQPRLSTQRPDHAPQRPSSNPSVTHVLPASSAGPPTEPATRSFPVNTSSSGDSAAAGSGLRERDAFSSAAATSGTPAVPHEQLAANASAVPQHNHPAHLVAGASTSSAAKAPVAPATATATTFYTGRLPLSFSLPSATPLQQGQHAGGGATGAVPRSAAQTATATPHQEDWVGHPPHSSAQYHVAKGWGQPPSAHERPPAPSGHSGPDSCHTQQAAPYYPEGFTDLPTASSQAWARLQNDRSGFPDLAMPNASPIAQRPVASTGPPQQQQHQSTVLHNVQPQAGVSHHLQHQQEYGQQSWPEQQQQQVHTATHPQQQQQTGPSLGPTPSQPPPRQPPGTHLQALHGGMQHPIQDPLQLHPSQSGTTQHPQHHAPPQSHHHSAAPQQGQPPPSHAPAGSQQPHHQHHQAQAPLQQQQHSSQHPLQQHRAPPAGSADADQLVREVMHAGGKRELFYASGRRVVLFANGTRKVTSPGGVTAINFANGDIKRQFPDGKTEYFYAEVGTWHTTYASGSEVFYFPGGQTEAHHPGGMKEIIFPDGAMRRVLPDGQEQSIPQHLLSSAVRQPQPVDWEEQHGELGARRR